MQDTCQNNCKTEWRVAGHSGFFMGLWWVTKNFLFNKITKRRVRTYELAYSCTFDKRKFVIMKNVHKKMLVIQVSFHTVDPNLNNVCLLVPFTKNTAFEVSCSMYFYLTYKLCSGLEVKNKFTITDTKDLRS